MVRDAATGALVREGRAPHPDGTEVDPAAWWTALQDAVRAAGGLDDVAAVSVGGQQHGMVCLDEAGEVVRPALLWNDTRSAAAAHDLVAELGGGAGVGRRGRRGAGRVVHGDQAALVRRARAGPGRPRGRGLPAARLADLAAAAVRPGWPRCAPTAATRAAPATGRRRPGPTGPTCSSAGSAAALQVPEVLGPHDAAGRHGGAMLGPGAGDNAAAALGVGAGLGDVVVSIGTSGVVSAVADVPARDPSGIVAGFADATGGYLPLVCTLNASRVLDATARLLGTDHDGLSRLALSAPAGADGLVLVPYLEGERTPDRPDATGALHGLTLTSTTPAHLARAAVEGLLCGLADGLDALVEQGAVVRRVLLVGGGARSEAVRRMAPAVLGCPVAGAGAGGVRGRRRRPAGRLGALGSRPAAGLGHRHDRAVRGRPAPRRPVPVRRGPRPDGEPGLNTAGGGCVRVAYADRVAQHVLVTAAAPHRAAHGPRRPRLRPVVGPAAATGPRGPSADLTYLSGTTIAAGATFGGTVVGGLSSLTYDAARGVYYALSDDQGAGFTPTSRRPGSTR